MSKLRVEDLNTRESKWDREGILGRCTGYVNFTIVIFRGRNETEDQLLRHLLILIDCLKRHQVNAQMPQSKQCRIL